VEAFAGSDDYVITLAPDQHDHVSSWRVFESIKRLEGRPATDTKKLSVARPDTNESSRRTACQKGLLCGISLKSSVDLPIP